MKSPRSDCKGRVGALMTGLRLDRKVQNKDTFFPPFLFLSADDGAACSQKPRRRTRAAPLHLIGNKIPAFSLSGLKHVYTSITR